MNPISELSPEARAEIQLFAEYLTGKGKTHPLVTFRAWMEHRVNNPPASQPPAVEAAPKPTKQSAISVTAARATSIVIAATLRG